MREKIAKIILVLGFFLLSPASGLAESILATVNTTPGCVGCPGEVFLFKFEGSNPLTALPPIPADLTSSPVYVAFNHKGELFVSSYLGLISRFTFDATGNFIPNGTITGSSLENVHGITFSPQGELFAANFSNGTISRFLFDAQGNATPNGTITVGGYNQGVAFSSNGELFNTDFGSNVRRFRFDTITGEAIPNGIFSVPDASRLHGLVFNAQGELFIADPDNDRVVRFLIDNDGNPVSNGLIPVPGIPLDVTFSPAGELFVATHQGGGLQRFLFDKNGDAFFNGFTPFEHLGGVAIFTSTGGGGEVTATLTPGISYQGRLLPQQYHRFSLQAQAGKALLIEVVPDEGVNNLSLDSKFGTIPLYAGTGVYTTKTKTPRGHYELVIAPTEDGIYYFSLFGNSVATTGGSYSITARYVDENYLSDLSRRSAGNNGSITLTLTGLGFTPDTEVTLSTAGLPPIVPTEIVAVSPTSLQVTFNLYGIQPGIYDLGVSLAGSSPSILQQALEVTGGAPAQLQSLIRLPPIVRPGRNYAFWFEYGNEGGFDLSPSLFVVSNDAGAGMRLTANEPFRDTSLQVLGVNLDGSAGYLPPGSSYRIPIYFRVPGGLGSGAEIGFKVEKMVADATLIDWAVIESQIRPADMDADAWRLVWANFRTQLGSTWADYLRRLSDDATYISRYRRFHKNDAIVYPAIVYPPPLTDPRGPSGDTALYDIRTLLQFEFAKATAGISPRTVLAAVQDVYVPAPGLPLTFGRLASPSLPGRFRLGPLGRGWTHSYEYSATLAANGDITIQGPGDFTRLFRSLGNGNYQGLAGDYGSVYFVGDNIVLREKDGMVWQFRSDGKLQSITDTNGNTLTLYYAGENLSHIDHSNGERLTLSYGDHGRINQITDPTGRTIVFHYDTSGEHLSTVEEPGGVVTAYAYQAADGSAVAHALNKITFPDGTHYYYSYDGQGRLLEEARDGGAERLSYAYDDQGTVTLRDALGHTALIRFGPYGEVLEVSDPLGALVKNAFDNKNELTQLTGPDGKSFTIGYDLEGNSIWLRDPLNHRVMMKFEPERSRLTELVDALSHKTDFAYDSVGNLQAITYPDTSKETFGYDGTGNVLSYANRRQQAIAYAHNARGQLTQRTYPDGRTINYQYDQKGNLIAADDSLTGRIDLQYDIRNFLTQIAYPGGYWFAFQYNNAGQRTQRLSHDGQILNYHYDSVGRLQRLSDGSGQDLVRYEYDINGRLTREIKGNGTQTSYAYDSAGQLLHLVNTAPSGAVQSRFDYTYDVNGNRTAMTTLEGRTQYQYDAIGQLTGVTYPNGRQETYEYDAAGNRVNVTDNGVVTAYTTNNLNQYTQVGSVSYSYDADGHMTAKADSTGTTTYEYDAENRLVRVVTPADGTWEYTYDALGNRIGVKRNGVVTRYVHDLIGFVDVAAEYDGSGALVARYTHGLGLVARTDGTGHPAYYAFDAIGHTRQMTDATGAVVNRYDYSPFGVPLQVEEVMVNPFRYVGRFGVMEEGNGLTFMRARYFEPELGSFITPDPKALVSTYAYTNNPINWIDPLGLRRFESNYGEASGALINLLWQFEKFVKIQKDFGEFGELIAEVQWAAKHTLRGTTKTWIIVYNGRVDPTPEDVGSIFAGGTKSEKRTILGEMPFPCELDELRGIKGACKPQLSDARWQKAPPAAPPSNYVVVASKPTVVSTSNDPNEKATSLGVGEDHYVVAGDTLTYTIYFENKSTATAPAQEVFIHDTLDPNLDGTTFRLGEVAFGSQVISSLAGKENGSDRVLLGNTVVDIQAQYIPGPVTGVARWTLRTIDPATGELPEDPLAGFLPPEDGTGRGQGYVTFSVRTRSDRPAGTQVINSASIVFDTAASLTTNQVFNTITDAAPNSPSVPSIGNEATQVPVTSVLSWAPSDFATSYDLYLWTSDQPQPVIPTAGSLSSPFYDPAIPLQYDTTYFWQVVARNVMGEIAGPVWSFSTQSGERVSVDLAPGFNLFAYPLVLPSEQLNCRALLTRLGTAEEIERISHFNPLNQQFETCSYAEGDFPITVGEGVLIWMKTAKTLLLSGQTTCPTITLNAGMNVIGHPAPPANLSCFGLLNSFGINTVTTIQRFNAVTGRFEACTWDQGGQVAGVDFPIMTGEGYLFHMTAGVNAVLPGCRN